MKPYKTEDWIKCELYKRLTNLGYEVYPEIQYRNKTVEYTSRRGRKRKVGVRADLAVYQDGLFVTLIEIKVRPVGKAPQVNGRQYKRYQILGLPFLYCMNELGIDETVEEVKTMSCWSLSTFPDVIAHRYSQTATEV